jgi:hypothetical protein
MFDAIYWLYLINSIFLINHEIDSAYWQEWNLFKIKGGISTFLLLHFPMLFFVLYGLIQVYIQTLTGLIFSLVLSISGIFAFVIHTFFMKRGYNEFKTPISIFILSSILLFSLIQLVLTVLLLIQN